MALFALYALDKKNGGADIRAANRGDHVAWLKSLGETLRVAGPILADNGEDMIGSLVIFEGESLAAIEALCVQDPYAIAGLFERVEIRPYKWVLGDGQTA